MRTASRKPLAVALCAQFLFTALPPTAGARPAPKTWEDLEVKKDWIVGMDIGQPSVWSLAQAHYLLAGVHDASRDLKILAPDAAALDPNRANSTRLEILRTLLGVEAQFDQAVGVKNRAALQTFEDRQARKADAQAELPAREAELRQTERDLQELEERRVTRKKEDELADAARGKNPPSEEDRARKIEIAQLDVEITHKTAEKTRLEGEVQSLRTTAQADVAAPEVTTSGPTGGAAALPAASGLTDFVKQFMTEAGSPPTLSASIALDNYLGMQYEIVAKRLTLLRDEVGPDERVVFLELPTSIYSVDRLANGYVSQVEWEITRFIDHLPASSLETDKAADPAAQPLKEQAMAATRQGRGGDKPTKDGDEIIPPYPITLDMIVGSGTPAQDLASDVKPAALPTAVAAADQSCLKDASRICRQKVRTLEIIPRQSALNINEHHATTSNFNFLGLFRLLSGVGAKIDYQRQREQYEKFLQQEVFASGFGKGSNRFGWTFGPLPGSKRIAPGQRTTYAVLAVPKDTLALELQATGRAYLRSVAPERGKVVGKAKFLVLVPGERTEVPFVEAVSYNSVPTGRGSVTATIMGQFFSPQLGIMVNGVPLKRVRSITRVGSDESARVVAGTGIEGEFEIPNSREIVLSFAMPAGYVGTPVLTVVAPERSVDINRFALKVNFRPKPLSLVKTSFFEPMFMEPFKLEPQLEEVKLESGDCKPGEGFVLYRLKGNGLRPGAVISVGDTELNTRWAGPDLRQGTQAMCAETRPPKPGETPRGQALQESTTNPKPDETPRGQALQESTTSYLLLFKAPAAKRWKVRYRQPNRQGMDEGAFEHRLPAEAAFKSELRHYRFSRGRQEAVADLTLAIPEKLAAPPVVTLDRTPGRGCGSAEKDQDGAFRVSCTVDAEDGAERDFMSVKVVSTPAPDPAGGVAEPTVRFVDVPLPVQVRVRSFTDFRTGTAQSPAGKSEEKASAVLAGDNLQRVAGVLFGDLEAKRIGAPDPARLEVEIPPLPVAVGERRSVPVILQTDTGALSTGFFYTYVGAVPKEEKK